jgi:hypothetical protein
MARDPGLRGETGLHHQPGLILTLAVSHTWAPLGLGQVFKAWALGLGTWIGRDSGLGTGGTILKVTWVLGPRETVRWPGRPVPELGNHRSFEKKLCEQEISAQKPQIF